MPVQKIAVRTAHPRMRHHGAIDRFEPPRNVLRPGAGFIDIKLDLVVTGDAGDSRVLFLQPTRDLLHLVARLGLAQSIIELLQHLFEMYLVIVAHLFFDLRLTLSW